MASSIHGAKLAGTSVALHSSMDGKGQSPAAQLVVSIVMLLLAVAMPAFGAPAEKVDVCHLTNSETNEWVLININDNAWETHAAHGDARVGDTVDQNCASLVLTCTVRDVNGMVAIYEIPEGGFVAEAGAQYYPLSSTDGSVLYLTYLINVSGDSGWYHFPPDQERKIYPVGQEGTDCDITPILYP